MTARRPPAGLARTDVIGARFDAVNRMDGAPPFCSLSDGGAILKSGIPSIIGFAFEYVLSFVG
jgi:hypothetical protein